MPVHLSDDLRARMITWREQDNMSVKEIARLAGCSERTVYEVLRVWRDYGALHDPTVRQRGRRRHLAAGDLDFLTGLLSTNPTLYLDEIQQHLYEDRHADVSISTVSRTLHRLNYSYKQISREALERNELLRATWQAKYGDIPKEYFVWLDESSVDDITNQRTAGWGYLGRACVRRSLFLRGQRYSVLPALTTEGIIALDIFEGSVTRERFVRFLEEQVAPLLSPYPGRRSVVVLDNCSIHHGEDIRRIIVEDCGARLIYLPPYSPDFNPIEQGFHSLKSWLRRHEAKAINTDVRPWLIHQAIASISADDATQWALKCGYE